jgi:F-box/leucine-rich repeat protein 2/20
MKTNLKMQGCFIGGSGLIAIREGCKLLRKLNLRFVEVTTDEGLIGLVKNCGQSLVSLADEGLIGLVKNCGQSLVSLAVANCQWLTDASLHAVGSHCPNLEILSMESDLAQSVGIISIAKGCRLLKTLKLQCLGAGDDALDAVGSFCLLLEILSH